MIKTLAGHVRFSLYEVKSFYQQATLTRTPIILLPSSPSLVPNFLNTSSGGKCEPDLSIQTYSLATGLQHQPIHGLLQDASLFISTDAFSFSRSLSLLYLFPPFSRRKGKYGKVDRLPLSSHHKLYYDTTLFSARSFRRLIFWFFF